MNEKDYDEQLAKARDFHGHICGGIAIGTKLAMYGLELLLAKLMGFIREDNGIYTLTDKGAFYFHYYENFYTLSYIDKMWGIMRREAFPEEIRL